MTELTVEEMQEPTPQPVSEEPPEPEPVAPEPEVQVEELAELPPEVADVEVPAPKKRGRPAGSKNKPKAKAAPKRRTEPTPGLEPLEPPPQIDVSALLEPIFRAYMATGELRKRQARQQRYDSLFQGMVGLEKVCKR